jgi:hypothetical protein
LTDTSFIFRFDFEPLAFRGGTISGANRMWSSVRSFSDARVIGMVPVGSVLRTYCARRFGVKMFSIFAMFSLKSSQLIVFDWVITLRISFDLLEMST